MSKSKSKRRTVPKNETRPKKIVSNPLVAKVTRDSVWFDFHSKDWLSSVRIRDNQYTNFLANKDEYLKNHFNLFHSIIPKIIAEWQMIIPSSGRHPYKHCHMLRDEKKELARKVYKEIHKHELSEDMNIWQFGFTGSIRLICLYLDKEKALIPVFIDHHHLIYDNLKYNQDNYSKYNYCIICDHI
ncbi:MAG: hypothetical protein R3250_12045 [Melioribacteraceae bacterium]|nr:hypothetical protein [Melioribacteraceae bacterium]